MQRVAQGTTIHLVVNNIDGAGDRRNDNGGDDDDERAEQATRGEDSPPVF